MFPLEESVLMLHCLLSKYTLDFIFDCAVPCYFLFSITCHTLVYSTVVNREIPFEASILLSSIVCYVLSSHILSTFLTPLHQNILFLLTLIFYSLRISVLLKMEYQNCSRKSLILKQNHLNQREW